MRSLIVVALILAAAGYANSQSSSAPPRAPIRAQRDVPSTAAPPAPAAEVVKRSTPAAPEEKKDKREVRAKRDMVTPTPAPNKEKRQAVSMSPAPMPARVKRHAPPPQASTAAAPVKRDVEPVTPFSVPKARRDVATTSSPVSPGKTKRSLFDAIQRIRRQVADNPVGVTSSPTPMTPQ